MFSRKQPIIQKMKNNGMFIAKINWIFKIYIFGQSRLKVSIIDIVKNAQKEVTAGV